MKDTIRVLRIRQNEAPEEVTISAGLESLQNEVGGDIECVYPYDDDVALIVNEEGKLRGLPLNRSLKDENGNVYDVIAGTFLIVGLTEDDFKDLADSQVQKFAKLFKYPEIFVSVNGNIRAYPVKD